MGDKRELLLSELKSDILNSYSVRRGQIKTLVKLSDEFCLFGCKESASVSNVISQINSALNTRKNRLDALHLMQNVVDQCTTETFNHYWEHWVKATVQIALTEDNGSQSQLACNILESLMFHLKSSEFENQFSTGLLPSILNELMQKLKDKDVSHHVVLIQVFSIIAKYFPGPCGMVAGKMENYVIPMFDSSNDWLQNLAADCYSLLPQCGGGGSMGMKHTAFWFNAVSRLVSGLHEVLDEMYSRLETGTSWPHRPALNLLRFDEVDIQEPCKTTTLALRFRGLSLALGRMLSLEFPAVVQLPILSVLEVIDRTLAISPHYLLAKPTSQRIHLSAVIPLIHEQALHVLRALTFSARRELVPYVDVVNSWFIQLLNWSNTPSGFEHVQGRVHGPLRCVVYDTLSAWMQSLGGASGVEMCATSLIRHAITDCTPPANTLKFKVNVKLGKAEAAFSAGKKRKANPVSCDLDDAMLYRKSDTESGSALCTASIEVLRNLMLYCGHSLTADHHRAIHDLGRLPITHFFKRLEADIPIPYNAAKCRTSLYRLLQSVLTTSMSQRPSPDQVIVRSFSVGLNDHSPEVRHCCAEALAYAENIVHPRLPVLGTSMLGSCSAVSMEIDCTDSSPFTLGHRGDVDSTIFSNFEQFDVSPLQAEKFGVDLNKNKPVTDVANGLPHPDTQATIQIDANGLPHPDTQATIQMDTTPVKSTAEQVSTSSKLLPVKVLSHSLPLSKEIVTSVSIQLASEIVEAKPVEAVNEERATSTPIEEINKGILVTALSDVQSNDDKSIASRKRKCPSDVEPDDDEIRPEDLEEMIQSFRYS